MNKKRKSILTLILVLYCFCVTGISFAKPFSVIQDGTLSVYFLGTTFSYTYDTDTPAGTDAPSVLDDRIREIKDAVQERLNVDHYFALTGSEVSSEYTGEHRKVTFYEPISTPTNITDKGFVYIKDASSVVELHWLDESGNELQLTSGGTIKKAGIEDSAFVPSGLISPYGGSSAPTGWLLCDGSAVSRTTYADLFSAIGTTYGEGNGSTTFNIPDLRGRVPVGLDAANVNLAAADALGETGGEEEVTLTAAESGVPAHTHGIGLNSAGGTGGSVPFISDHDNTVINYTYDTNENDAASASEGHNNLQPYNTVNYIIKT